MITLMNIQQRQILPWNTSFLFRHPSATGRHWRLILCMSRRQKHGTPHISSAILSSVSGVRLDINDDVVLQVNSHFVLSSVPVKFHNENVTKTIVDIGSKLGRLACPHHLSSNQLRCNGDLLPTDAKLGGCMTGWGGWLVDNVDDPELNSALADTVDDILRYRQLKCILWRSSRWVQTLVQTLVRSPKSLMLTTNWHASTSSILNWGSRRPFDATKLLSPAFERPLVNNKSSHSNFRLPVPVLFWMLFNSLKLGQPFSPTALGLRSLAKIIVNII